MERRSKISRRQPLRQPLHPSPHPPSPRRSSLVFLLLLLRGGCPPPPTTSHLTHRDDSALNLTLRKDSTLNHSAAGLLLGHLVLVHVVLNELGLVHEYALAATLAHLPRGPGGGAQGTGGWEPSPSPAAVLQ